MEEALTSLLEGLYADGLAHDEDQPDRLRRRRNLEPDAAALLHTLVLAVAPRRMVEIGTSNGYSAIWFGAALAGHGGRLLSVDLDATAQQQARTNLDRAGLAEIVELRTADGGAVLAELAAGSVDVLFLDSERPEYAGWWPHPLRVLRPGGLLIADNVLSHPEEIAALRGLVEAEPTLSSTVVAVGKGELIAVKARS